MNVTNLQIETLKKEVLEEIRRQQVPKQKEIRARKIYAHLSVAA